MRKVFEALPFPPTLGAKMSFEKPGIRILTASASLKTAPPIRGRIAGTLGKLCALAFMLGIFYPAAAMAGPILQIDSNGILIGAQGVKVGLTTYNVQFERGVCTALFSGCGAVATFPFPVTNLTDSLQARAASQALLDQVFVGAFDTSPGMINGCQGLSTCGVLTPYANYGGSYVMVTEANNGASEGEDFIYGGGPIN